MEDASSPAEWKASMQSRLEQELPKAAADPIDRVRWLARHLEEYIDRWAGFVEHPAVASQPSTFPFESGLFVVIGLAVDLLQRELASTVLLGPAEETWNSLVSVHARMRQHLDLSSREHLQRLGGEFYAKLAPQ